MPIVQECAEQWRRFGYTAASVCYGQGCLLMAQELPEFPLRLRYQIRYADVIEMKRQRQRVDEHAQRLASACRSLQPAREHGAKNDILSTAGSGDNQSPSSMEQYSRCGTE